MKIIIDCYGADNSPVSQVAGAISAMNKDSEINIVFVGRSEEIAKELEKYEFDESRVEILNADDEITCEDKPTVAIREKKNSSLVRALDYLKGDDSADALISSGSTGAILTGGILKVGRIKGISRPALAPLLPTMDNKCVMLIDCGANSDCKPVHLQHFALMGSMFFKEVKGIDNPRVALLSNGTEEEKGCELTKAAFELIKTLPDINFIGNIEARDLLSGVADVVVSDGFNGNIALKASEGAIMLCLKTIKSEIKTSFIAKIGALLMKKQFKNIKKKMDYSNHGGAMCLGMDKLIIKAHGSANLVAVETAVMQAVSIIRSRVIEKIKNGITLVGEEE